MSLDKICSYGNTFELCMKELFLRVGLKYPNKRFTNQTAWYLKRCWTWEDQGSFRDWLLSTFKSNHPYWDKKTREWLASMFIVNYGWAMRDDLPPGSPAPRAKKLTSRRR